MSAGKILTPFFDLKDHVAGKSGFFFLEHILKAREDLHIKASAEKSCDQELNVYIAGLLNSLIYNGDTLGQKPYISPFDFDIQNYLGHHPGLRSAYNVYRENADFGLLFFGLFTGHPHDGSYHQLVIHHQEETGRIALYYEFAASALAHLQGTNVSLIEVLETLSEHIEEILKILKYTAAYYFDMMERISTGSMFHLERELDEMQAHKKYETKLDEFLRCYTTYTEHPSQEGKESLMVLADELKRLKNGFKCDLF
jgi:hypothetical protein